MGSGAAARCNTQARTPAALVAALPRLAAQVPDPVLAASAPVPGSGHHYLGAPAETVNPADGSVSLEIPVLLPGGRRLTLPFGFRYSSREDTYLGRQPGSGPYQISWIQSPPSAFQAGGWGYDLPVLTVSAVIAASHAQPTCTQNNGPGCWVVYQEDATTNYVFRGVDGSEHTLWIGITEPDAQSAAGDTTYSLVSPGNAQGVLASSAGCQGCGFNGAPQVTVTDASGTVYQFGQLGIGVTHLDPNGIYRWGEAASSITDRNGNQIVASGTGYRDALGRQVVAWTGIGNNGDTVSVAGLATPFTLHWGNATETFPEQMTNLGPGACTLASGGSVPVPAVTEIDLPNGQKWTFTYDPTYGRLARVNYPGGGYVRYVWGLNSQSAASLFPSVPLPNYSDPQATSSSNPCSVLFDVPAVTDRYVSYDGTHEVLHQHFAYTTTWDGKNDGYWTSKQTTVTSTDLLTGLTAVTVYNYAPIAESTPPFQQDTLAPQIPVETSVVYQDGGGRTLRTVYQTWANERELAGQQEQLDNGQNSAALYCYNSDEQRTDSDRFDFQRQGAAGPAPGCYSTASPALPGGWGPLLRRTVTAYHNFMGGTPSTHIVNAPDSVTVYDGSVNTVAATTFAYDAGSPASSGAINLVAAPGLRGNPTSVAKWVGGSNWLTTNYAWFDDGQLAQATDPAGDTTSYGYNDAWASGSSPGQTHAYPTLITDALGHTRSYTWNYAGGELATAKDDNGQTTSFTYNDPLLRLTQTNFPDGGETTAAYSDAPGAVAIEVRRLISGSSWTDAWTYFDGLGHAVTQCSANGEAVPWDRVDTTYDGEGHRSFVAYLYQAPNCTSANNEPGDSFAFDALGRATQVTHSDGNSILTSYTGAATELQDEGNGTSRVARISQADGLDRVISVCEVTSASLPGNGGTPAACNLDIAATGFLTNYGYSALGDLTSVAQAGLNNRTFAYDGLSRLTSAANPESGAIQYTYDVAACGAPASAGDLTCRTDARGITTAYSYDHLHRLTQKAYSDGTPTVSYGYDQTSIWGWTLHNTVGRLSYAGTSSASGGFFDYDPMGRVAIRGRCTPSTCGTGGYVYSYSYDSAGDVVASQMEQSATIDIAYNQALRPTGETSSLNDGNHPGTLFSLAHYNARGELLSATLGNGLSEARGYDARGRLTSLAAGAAYSTGATYAPDGDVTASTDSANGNWSYGYDALNRLISAAGNGVTIGYGYDRFGNMWQHTISPAPSPAPPTLSFDANNRIVGASYDAAGDLLTDPVTGCRFSYDAAQRITGVAGCATASYAYNAQGQREHTVVNGVTREYVSGRAGESRTVFAGQSQLVEGNVYVGGRDLATYAGGTTYFDHGDGLGTVRARSNLSGGVVEAYSSLPYGGWLNQVGTVSALHFTGKQFDGETSLTYFPARFQSGYSGRFMTPDWSARPEAVPYANVGNPQSLNLYLYTLDNPVTNTDADGHICIFGIGNTCHPDPKAPPPPPPPLALPIAQLHTSTRGGYTVFQWSDKSGGYHEDKVRSLVKADHRSKPGAAGPIESYVVGQIQGLTSPKYGPAGAQIDTGDSRDRWIHGGGSSLADPYAPHQILTPTFGCTRACNADVQRLGREITIFQKLNPEMPIPYSRTDQ